jgi:hypothetical protein
MLNIAVLLWYSQLSWDTASCNPEGLVVIAQLISYFVAHFT